MEELIFILTVTYFITRSTKEYQIFVESEHTGVERMIIKSKLDITIKALGGTPKDHPFISSNLYGAAYTGYVEPAYGNGNTSVTATFLSSTKDGFISYHDKQYKVGDSFNVLEFFNESHSVATSYFFYVGTDQGLHDVQIRFESNRETVIITNDSFFFI